MQKTARAAAIPPERRYKMTIEKNGKVYTVRENKNSWTVARAAGRVSVSYNVPKDICPTFSDLKSHISESDLF